jgi:hypothetical protein
MTSRDFRFWLHGFMEISSRRFFTQRHILSIVDHLKIIDKPDSFINWLEGAFESAHACGGLTSHAFYSLVEKELGKYFDKQTPDRKEEIKEACDGIMEGKIKLDEDALKRLMDNLEKGVTCSPITPSIQPYQIGGYVPQTPSAPAVFCGRQQ